VRGRKVSGQSKLFAPFPAILRIQPLRPHASEANSSSHVPSPDDLEDAEGQDATALCRLGLRSPPSACLPPLSSQSPLTLNKPSSPDLMA
jgi:hypothetical protein